MRNWIKRITKKVLENTRKEGEQQVKILIVEDNKDLLETISETLKDEGYNVISALDGYEAIERVKEGGVKIIIMDLKLPRMDGMETYRAIKKIEPTAVTVMMTGYAASDMANEAISEGAYGILQKPFETDELLNMIKKITG